MKLRGYNKSAIKKRVNFLLSPFAYINLLSSLSPSPLALITLTSKVLSFGDNFWPDGDI